MDWELAIEKNHEALRRILAMLVGMVGMVGGGDQSGDVRENTPPRHLHRFVLRLLRPAEAAMRRLIIVAARGIVVTLPKVYARKPRPKKPPLNRKNGYGTGLVIRPGPLPEWVKALVPKRSPRLSLPLLDPMKRFGVRRKYAKASAMPQIRLLGDDGPIVPFFRRPEPVPPPPPTPDDPLDAANIRRRLDVLRRALDDLPKQALRMARWQARRDARLAAEREAAGDHALRDSPSPSRSFTPPSVLPDISPSRGEISHSDGKLPIANVEREALPHTLLSSPLEGEMSGRTEGGVKGRDGEEGATGFDGEGINWAELGLTPEALALCRRRKERNAQSKMQPSSNSATTSQQARRFHRISPMRPGHPPGWRKRQNHDVYEVLNELHGLAVWASERRDSS
jgi:hypothetical protein